MSKFKILADKAISEHKGEEVDSYLKKIARDNNLNINEHQRLVEEYNIGAFLTKLQEGSHHEEYSVASPVVSELQKEASDLGDSLEKVAETKPNYTLTDDMFNVDFNDDYCDVGDLQKVAMADIDIDLFNSEEKWDKATAAREELLNNMNMGRSNMEDNDARNENIGRLTKMVSASEGLMKTAISTLALVGKEDDAIQMLENSKFSINDIVTVEIEDLSKEASEILSYIIGE